MIEISALHHSYGDREVLRGLDLEIPSGTVFALLGPNGSGKTTLFRILSTLMPVQSGRVRINGFDPKLEAADIRRSLGVLFQHPALDGKLRVVENLRCGGHLFGMSGSRLEESIKEWTQATGVADRLGDFVETLSGGLRRRVEIAKALLPSPGILLLDEPSSGLDPGARAACREIFRQLQSRGLTVVMTTHLMEEAEEADLVAVLHDGQIVAQGPPAALCGELGEFVLLVRARDPGGLVAWVESREDRPAIRRTGDEIRLYSPQVADWQSLLLEHRGGQILSTTLARPGLEDVFAHHTGITIAEAEARFSPV